MPRSVILLAMLCCAVGSDFLPVAASFAAQVPPVKRQAAAAPDAQLAARAEKLRKTAVGNDWTAAEAALAELKSLGEPSSKSLLGALRQLLGKDKIVVLKGATAASAKGAEAKFADIQARIDSARASARANLEHLDKGEPVRKAREFHDDLVKLLAELNTACAAREPIRRLMHRRPALLATYREVAPAGEVAFDDAAEAKLLATVEKALGKPLAKVEVVPSLAEQPAPPEDPVLRHLWFYRASRDIEAYNAAQRSEMSRGEWENLTLVNRYREALGILPFELDARLVQSARRHSREMNDEQYFSHESPTRGLKTYVDRMRAAGYGQGCYSENIAAGPPSGEQTFWGWFDSPSHHRSMVHAASTTIGIGQWDRLWTQHMGTGQRLMVQPPAERAKVAVQGEMLKPRR